MISHDLDALIQGAIDHALTPEEQALLARLIDERPEVRARVAQFEQLASLLESLDAPKVSPGLVGHVLDKISHQPLRVSQSTFPRGIAVTKKILFGLAAAAVIVLAVITYSSNPPATVGTEATIGAAQRAQTPQINPSDVKLGDTSAQDVLQTETFDAIMKDEHLSSMLQDAELRKKLQDDSLRKALEDDEIRAALADPALARRLEDAQFKKALADPGVAKKFADDASLRAMLKSPALRVALQDDNFRQMLSRSGYAAALAGPAMRMALQDPNFAVALRSPSFAARLRNNARVQ